MRASRWATGELRAKTALVEILEAFIETELQPRVSTFPDDFYSEMFRLRGLDYPRETVKRPQYFGHLTNDIVYKRLAPGVLTELKKVTPRDDRGRRKHKYFHRLTTNIGYPKLREHLGSVVTLMKLSADWGDFTAKLDRIRGYVAAPVSAGSGRHGNRSLGGRSPASPGGLLRGGPSLLCGHFGGAGLAALEATLAPERDSGRVLAVVRLWLLDLARRDVHDQ